MSESSRRPAGELLTLHDEEVGVVDVELYALEEVLHGCLSRTMSADEVLAGAVQRDLWSAKVSSASFDRTKELTWRVTEISGICSNPTGALDLSELSKTMVTEARVTPAWPRL